MEAERMITLVKLKVYERYKGDIDGIHRAKDKIGLEMEKIGEWKLIDDTVQRLTLEKNGVASKEFCDETASILAAQFEKSAADYFKKMKA